MSTLDTNPLIFSQKYATMGARQMWSNLIEASLRGVLCRGNSDVRPHGEQLAKGLFAFQDGVLLGRSSAVERLTAFLGCGRSGGRRFNPCRSNKAPFFCRRVTRDTHLGLHGLTRQETPSRDTPRVVRPNLAQVSVMLLVLRWITRPTDKANGPSRALGFFAALLGPPALIALNSGAREPRKPLPIHPRQRHSLRAFSLQIPPSPR